MSGRPWILEEATWPQVADARYDVAVLPWGSTEPHNRHVPYGSDTLHAGAVARAAAKLAWAEGARVVVLPTVPFGVQSGQLDLPCALHMGPAAQTALVRDLARALQGQGLRKLVILNGHGGNDFRSLIRELQPELDIFLCTADWWRSVDDARYFDDPGDHAGEAETSVILALRPDLVAPLEEAGPGRARRFVVPALNEAWAWAPRAWSQVTDDTGVGDPGPATEAKGRAYLNDAVEAVARFLIDLAAADPEAMYG